MSHRGFHGGERALARYRLLAQHVGGQGRQLATSGFVEHARTHGDFATAGAAAVRFRDGGAGLVLLGAGDVPVRADAAERALAGGAHSGEAAALAAAVPLGLAALLGIHTFAGTVREAFPINTFMTILICCFAAADLAWTRLDGSTRDRAGVVAAFQADAGPPVLLLSLGAGGTGLNLTAADHIFLLDQGWNPAVEEQAADRAHRIGQTRPVTVYRLIARGTIEEQIVRMHGDKRALVAGVLEGSDVAARLSTQDLLALLAAAHQPLAGDDDDRDEREVLIHAFLTTTLPSTFAAVSHASSAASSAS